MNENKDGNPNIAASKDLLYSEILGTSVVGHVHGLLQKKKKNCMYVQRSPVADHIHGLLPEKKKNCTYHVERSPVLERVSQFLQSIKKCEDVQNIEVIEEGEPVIDMSVTLIEKEDGSECDSDVDEENEELENGAEDKKIIMCSDSNSEQCESESEENVLKDKNLLISSDSDSELSENESEETVFKNMFITSNLDSEHSECKNNKNIFKEKQLVISSKSDDEQSESEVSVLKDTKLLISSNSGNKQSENESKEVVLKDKRFNVFSESNDKLSDEERYANVEKKNYLEPSKSDFGLLICDSLDPSYKDQSYIHNSSLSVERKRKLISVLENDEQNLCFPKTQKKV